MGKCDQRRDSAQPLVPLTELRPPTERESNSACTLLREKRKLTNSSTDHLMSDTSDWQRTLYLSSWKTALTHSFTHPSTHSYTHSLIHPLTHSLTHWLTHSLTHPPIPTCYMYISLLGWRKYLFCDLSDQCVTITFLVHTTLHSPINQWTNRSVYLSLYELYQLVAFIEEKRKSRIRENVLKKVDLGLSSFFFKTIPIFS